MILNTEIKTVHETIFYGEASTDKTDLGAISSTQLIHLLILPPALSIFQPALIVCYGNVYVENYVLLRHIDRRWDLKCENYILPC